MASALKKKITEGTSSCGVKSAYGIHYHSRSESQTLQTHWKIGWIILWPIITFVALAVGYSRSNRWWHSQCTVIAAGAAMPSVSLWVLPRENVALSSYPCQPEVCNAPRSAHCSTQPEESSSLFMFALGKEDQEKALAGLVKFGPFWECVLGTASGDWWKFIFCV